jgi:hypothetical protein
LIPISLTAASRGPAGAGSLTPVAPFNEREAQFRLRAYFLNPKSPLTHLNENGGFHDPGFQVCVAAAS